MPRSSWPARLLAGSGIAVLGLAAVGGFGRDSTPAVGAERAPSPRAVESREENPTVAAGRVSWHGSFADAKAASAKSGKPVLLFHMMGQLDRQFC
jgi:hypothetical protein